MDTGRIIGARTATMGSGFRRNDEGPEKG